MKVFIQYDEYDGTARSLNLDIEKWWWEDELLCLVFSNGKRQYFNRRIIREFEAEGLSKF